MKRRSNEPLQQELDELRQELATVQNKLNRLRSGTEEKNSRLSTILSNMEDGLMAVNEQNEVVLLSPRAEELAGAGKSLFVAGSRHIMSETTAAILQATGQVIESQTPQQLSLVDNGRELEVAVTPIRSKYMPFDRDGALAILRDVTEMRRLERLRGEFVTNVSHELRTPLTAIAGFVETLQLDPNIAPSDHARALEIIALETNRLRRLISELLLLSHIENDLMRQTDESFALAETMERAATTIGLLASERGHSFRYDPPANDCVIAGRGEWLLQALINLGENAVKYTPPNGEIVLTAKFVGQQVQITVKDNGAGIPAEDLPRIFERFYRVEKSRSGKSGGSGLGLSIVKHIVAELRGEITVDSTVGKGSRFTITLQAIAEQE